MLGTAAPDAGCSTELREGSSLTVLSQLPLAAPAWENQVAGAARGSWLSSTMVQRLPAVSLALSTQAPELPQAHINGHVTTLMQADAACASRQEADRRLASKATMGTAGHATLAALQCAAFIPSLAIVWCAHGTQYSEQAASCLCMAVPSRMQAASGRWHAHHADLVCTRLNVHSQQHNPAV